MDHNGKKNQPKTIALAKESDHTANVFKVLLAIALCLAVLGLIESQKDETNKTSFSSTEIFEIA